MSRFLVPRVTGAEVLERPRLFERLTTQLAASSVVWVTGPAGSGKTTLVGSYLLRSGQEFRMCTLRPHDRDPAVLFDTLLAAAAIHGERLPFPGLGVSQPALFSRQVWRRIFAERERLFVIDDEHSLGDDAALAEVMTEAAAEAASAGARLLVVSRRMPPPPLDARVSAGQVAILGSDELSFSTAECAAWAKQRLGDRADAELESLVSLSSGWAVCLVLMVEHLRMGGALRGRPAALPSQVFAYLAEEVLSGLDWTARECLLWCALLPHARLEDVLALCGDESVAQALTLLEMQRFLCRTDATSLPYVHPILAEACLRFGPNVLGEAAWLERLNRVALLLARQGDGDSALGLWLRAGFATHATSWVKGQAPLLVAAGRAATLQSWLSQLPEDACSSDAWLSFWSCALSYFGPDRVQRLRAQAERFRADADTPGIYSSWCVLAQELLADRNILALCDHLQVLESYLVEFPLHALPDLSERVEQLRLFARFLTEPDTVTLPQLVDLVRRLATSRDNTGSSVVAVSMIFWQAYIFRTRQDLEALLAELRAYQAAGNDNALCSLVAGIGATQSAYFRGDYASVDREWERACQIALQLGLVGMEGYQRAARCTLAVEVGDMELAREQLARAKVVPGPGFLFGNIVVGMARAWFACRTGNLVEARVAVEEGLALARVTQCPAVTGFMILIRAQIDAADGNFERAVAELEQFLAQLTPWAPQLRNSMSAALAIFSLRLARKEQARVYAAQAFAGMARAGHLVVSANPLHDFARLCAFALEQGIEAPFVRELIRERRLQPAPDARSQAWPWALRIQALGPLTLWANGVPLSAPRGKARELLCALVALGGRDVSIEKLCDSLWPEADGDRARSAFDTTLHRLRKSLGDDALLELREQRLSLSRQHCYLDCEESALTHDSPVLLEGEAETPWLLGARKALRTGHRSGTLRKLA